MRSLFAVAALASALLIPTAGNASILFDSGANPLGTAPDFSTDFGFRDVGHFSLANDSVLDSVSLYIWMNPTYAPVALDWAIESADGVVGFSSGTNAALTNSFFGTARGQYDVYLSTFNVADLGLGAGDYRLVLSNCGTGATGCGWGAAEGGTDFQYEGNSQVAGQTFAFSVQGDLADAPEPSTWMMMGTALIGFAGSAIRKRRA